MIRNASFCLWKITQDVELTLRAFEKSNVINEIVVACDGELALITFSRRALTRIATER